MKKEKNLNYISKLLEILKENLTDDKKEKYYLEQQLMVNLKIANLNFKLKNYSETLECLQNLEKFIDPVIDPMNVFLYSILLKYLGLFYQC